MCRIDLAFTRTYNASPTQLNSNAPLSLCIQAYRPNIQAVTTTGHWLLDCSGPCMVGLYCAAIVGRLYELNNIAR